ncbi:IS110 family RNA-guided transposase [Labilibaculum euxinus]|uniref:IS110 family transposase n=1 Tax=Labilibaculum euxinus TaxID=2686357 RepID=A0A7M4DBV8_9BACT|nr:IS110 family transposase [Labilibaculum euxinus]MUP40137.1 IS110 family transposase [Labilibaculum euxinus]MVB09342.1 IS110 family transposase [Labilibaculum euxinus]
MKEKEVIEFEQVVECGSGMDVHKDIIVATIQGKGIKTQTKSFKSFTSSLIKLREWLLKNKVTHVAMESTGVYWKPVFNVLGDDFMILLVNARHVKNVPGHKTDKKDSRWLAKLLLSGLLKGSFIPERRIRELRDLTRYKTKLTNQISAERNRFQKILEDANIKLSSVLNDVFGATGTKIINHILSCEDYRPEQLLQYVHGRVKASREDIKEALTGYITPHHKFMLKTIMGNISKVESTVSEVEAKINNCIEPFKIEQELLESIPGVGKDGANKIIAEVGVDMEQFPDQNHLASWAGVCPGSNESAGKNKSGRITYGNKYLRSLLVECGWAASRTKNTYLSAKYKSLAGRRGKKKAIIALGHKILIATYFIIKDKVAFNELGADHLNNFRRDRLIAYYKQQLEKLTAA